MLRGETAYIVHVFEQYIPALGKSTTKWLKRWYEIFGCDFVLNVQCNSYSTTISINELVNLKIIEWGGFH